MEEQRDIIKQIIDDLIYASYKTNRQLRPDIPAKDWRLVFSNAQAMEIRLISESN